MNQAPNIADLTDVVYRVFRPERVSEVVLHGWHLTILIRTDRHQRITKTELDRLQELLGIAAENLELWDVHGGGVELSVDTDPSTPLDKPR